VKDGEKIYLESAYFETNEDSYTEGELPHGSGSRWTDSDLGFDRCAGYGSVEDALKALMDKACFTFRIEDWEIDPCGEDDFGRLETDILVCADNSEATAGEIAQWKAGRIRLWNCRVCAHFVIRTDSRQLSASDAREFRLKAKRRKGA